VWVGEERNLTTKEMISIFPLSTFHLYVATFQQYGVYISQMIRYSRAYSFYHDFLDRGLLLTRKLLNQEFLLVKLKSSLRKFYGRHYDLINRYDNLCHKWSQICSTCRKHFPPILHAWRITGFVTRVAWRVFSSGAIT
jgi:hypothetical protein